MNWEKIKHFKPKEFDDPDYPGSWKHMDPETIFLLDRLREDARWPIITHNKYGIKGCVCMDAKGHSKTSRHYVTHPGWCSAVDWHFLTNEDARVQVMAVLRSGFTGIGIYYDWSWDGSSLSIGFHVDRRDRPQVWRRDKGKYLYLLH